MADTVSTTPLRLISLEASAFKRLRAVSITFPAGKPVVTISGRNGQGKSSVLDAIAAALGGGSYKPERPIRKGHKKAEIVADLGEIVVKRTYTESGGTLTVEAADGSPIKSPQAVLDKLYTTLAFDPLAFTRMEPRNQIAELKRVAGLDAVFAKLDAERAAAVAARTEAARSVKTLEMALAGLPDVPGPDAEVSVATLAAELQAANETKTKNANGRAWLVHQTSKIDKMLADAEQMEAVLADLRKKIEQERVTLETHASRVVPVEADPDIAAISARIARVEQDNANARRRMARAETLAKLKAARELEKKADRAVEDASIKRDVTLAEAKLPVSGLGFTEDGVTLNGVPFEQASSAEQIRASVAMGLASKPRLPLMLVREGSLLDNDAMQLLAELAAEHGAQVIVERVTNGQAVGVVIEDGEVAQVAEEVA